MAEESIARKRKAHRRLQFALVGLFLLPLPVAQASAEEPCRTDAGDEVQATARLFDRINEERTRAGLASFARRDDLDAIAADFSRNMAREGRISHNPEYLSPDSARRLGASRLGENVASSFSVEPGHKALMDSPSHWANLLDASFTFVGIGLACSHDDTLYITEDFLEPARR